MQNEIEPTRSGTPVVRKAVAGVVLLVAVALAIRLIIGAVAAIFGVLVFIAVAVAVLWALKTIFW